MSKRTVQDTAFNLDDNSSIERILVAYDEASQRGFSKMRLNISVYDGYVDSVEVTGERLETDEEYERRLLYEKKQAAKIKKAKEAKLAYERTQYERLKKKFEGK